MSGKRKALLAYKESVLKELKYFESRIDEIKSRGNKSNIYHDSDSSDSEFDLTSNIDVGPPIAQLRQQQIMLKTCVQATLELTSLQISQSEVNIKSIREAPEFQGEPPILEDGMWSEVTVDCRVDLVPFTMEFFVHQPTHKFKSCTYRGLDVKATKTAHQAELIKSILPTVKKPSEAFEVLKSYAAAHRSRRTTLARLAEKFAGSLHMEPMANGGYLLKCANLLEVMWTLQNKWSPVAPFHHRMKFDLEYMDESYIKIITQSHHQLSDPSIETGERTFLLSKIISTCLEAQGPTQELYESMSSDPESAQNLSKGRTALDQEPEAPVFRGKKERELMAPPKSLPKRAKPKAKENTVENRKSHKDPEEGVVGAKKSKNNDGTEKLRNEKDTAVDDNVENDNVSNDDNEIKTNIDKDTGIVKNVENKKARKNVSDKNKVINTQNVPEIVSGAVAVNGGTSLTSKNIEDTEKLKKVKGAVKDKEKTQNVVLGKKDLKKNVFNEKGNKAKAVADVAESNENKKSTKENIQIDTKKHVVKEKNGNTKQKPTDTNRNTKQKPTVTDSSSNKANNVNKVKKIDHVEGTLEKIQHQSNSAVKRKSNLADRADKENDVVTAKQPKLSKADTVSNKLQDKNKQTTLKNPSSAAKGTTLNKPKNVTGTLKLKPNSAENVSNIANISKLSSDKTSKLPVKRMESAVNMKKNHLRISPRKLPSNFGSRTTNQQKILTKTTSIPRLKKPMPKK